MLCILHVYVSVLMDTFKILSCRYPSEFFSLDSMLWRFVLLLNAVLFILTVLVYDYATICFPVGEHLGRF